MINNKKGYRHLPAFILLLLAEKEYYGNAIYNVLEEKLPKMNIDSGAIYRTLQQLEKCNCVTYRWDTNGTGPARKIYSISKNGYEMLKDAKRDIEDRIENLKYFIEEYNNIIRMGSKNGE